MTAQLGRIRKFAAFYAKRAVQFFICQIEAVKTELN